MRCGIFGKSRTGRSSRVPEKFFVKVLEKVFGEIVLGKIWWRDSLLTKIFANGISWRGRKPTADERRLGSLGNPGFGNLNIAKGCNRMVERSRGHMGHIEGHFRDLFSVQISRKTFRKMGYKCPICPQGKTISTKTHRRAEGSSQLTP